MKKKAPSNVICLDRKKNPNEAPFPPMFTPSYPPVPSTSTHTTLPGPEHAKSSNIESAVDPMNLLRKLDEPDL